MEVVFLQNTLTIRELARPIGIYLFILFTTSCQEQEVNPITKLSPSSSMSASPNASIFPTPLSTATPLSNSSQVVSEAPLPGFWVNYPSQNYIRPDLPLDPENQTLKEVPGVSMIGTWKFADTNSLPRGHELSNEVLRQVQEKVEWRWKIDSSLTGHMRVVFDSDGFHLPRNTEIRSRFDRFGSILLWPDGLTYRLLPYNSIRTLLDERRVDVLPTQVPTIQLQGQGKRLKWKTRKILLKTHLGSLLLELATIPELSHLGKLLCRLLIEINGIEPKIPVCKDEEIPVFASYSIGEGGIIFFEIQQISRVTNMVTSPFMMPPSSASFQVSGLPPKNISMISEEEMLTLHIARKQALTPEMVDLFQLSNNSDEGIYVFFDNIPLFFLTPQIEQSFRVPKGKHWVQWKSFFSNRTSLLQSVDSNGSSHFGQSISPANE